MKKVYNTIEEQQKAANTRAKQKRLELRAEKSRRKFRAFDGEGVNLDSKHEYILLMNNEDKWISRTTGLTTLDCLGFLVDTCKDNSTVNVCFGASYDVNMMLKDVSKKKIAELHQGKTISFRNYTIRYLPRKCFIVRRFKDYAKHYIKDDKTGAYKLASHEKCILWDVFGFFQKSFIASLKDFFTEDERKELYYDEIVKGKERRSQFSTEELENFIVPYTGYEVNALVALMNRLQDYCIQAGIVLKRWDGAGAVAASILEQNNVRLHYGTLPDEVITPAQYAYGGARIEMIQYGHFQAAWEWIKKTNKKKYHNFIHHYDIISAYPSVLVNLLSMQSGKWMHYTGTYCTIDAPDISLYKIHWRYPYPQPFYPFFYRNIDDSIIYPSDGYNWVCRAELVSALKHLNKMGGIIDIEEQYSFYSDSDIRPYAFIQDLYNQRMEWKNAGLAVQLVLKLGLNSLYGKTVQTLGYDEETGKIPPFFNLIYGLLITGTIRAKMFDAAMQAPLDIIAFATDGIWSTRELDLPVSQKLGDWEYERIINATFVQSGFYWTENESGKKTFRYRGFDPNSVSEQSVLDAWKNNIYNIDVPSTRFVGMGSALASDERFETMWRTWPTINRQLKLYPGGKRNMILDMRDVHNIQRTGEPYKQLVPTYPRENGWFINTNEMSIKHYLPWIDNRETNTWEEEENYIINDEHYDSYL